MDELSSGPIEAAKSKNGGNVLNMMDDQFVQVQQQDKMATAAPNQLMQFIKEATKQEKVKKNVNNMLAQTHSGEGQGEAVDSSAAAKEAQAVQSDQQEAESLDQAEIDPENQLSKEELAEI